LVDGELLAQREVLERKQAVAAAEELEIVELSEGFLMTFTTGC
jgi:hypothetical protein